MKIKQFLREQTTLFPEKNLPLLRQSRDKLLNKNTPL